MKSKNRLFYMFCVICIFIGGIMPYISPYIQDHYFNDNEYKDLDLELLSISDDYDIEELLFALADYHNELDYNGKTHLSYEEVETYAKEETMEFIENSVLPEFDFKDANVKYSVYMVSPKTISYSQIATDKMVSYYTESQSQAFLIWKCDFFNVDGIIYSIKLDDRSGKIVALSYRNSSVEDASQFESDQIDDYSQCKDFISEYYNLNGKLYSYKEKKNYSYSYEYNNDNYCFTLVKRNNYVSMNY